MYILSFLIRDIEMRKQRTQQKRIALQLLTFSGVVRPGHVELRYPTTLIGRTAYHPQRITSQHPLIQPFPLRSWERTIALHLKQTWHWVSSLGMASQRPAAGRNDRGTCAV